MPPITLTADCARCAALCCVAYPFERGDKFGVGKAASEPCPNLNGAGQCGIYAEREARGFSGCIAYDCVGAGSWTTQALFQGRSWRDDPTLLKPMVDAFLIAERGHRRLQLLHEAGKLDLSAEDREVLDRLIADLEDAMADGDRIAALETEAAAFLRSLRSYVTPPSR